MLIYEKEEIIKASYNESKNYIIFDWDSFLISLDDIKILHQKALDTAKEKNCYDFIAETSKVKNALSQEIIDWWSNEWFPILQDAGLKTIITVLPKSAIAKLSTKSWQNPVKVGSVTTINVASLEEAENCLKN